MKIAIVHYHLQPGGVTRVIEHTVAALAAEDCTVAVLSGRAPAQDMAAPCRVVPGLQYESARPHLTPAELARELREAARDALEGMPDIWHVHNHCLGKNLLLPQVLAELAGEGERLLLHIHDFAEDGRPANYQMMLDRMAGGSKTAMSRLLYPAGDHVHYGVLNGRDFSFMRDAGLAEERLHLLPNPVELPVGEIRPPEEEERPLFLYPTRAIRRKNLGEFLLWAAISGSRARFATTLGPENPRERPRYEDWQRFAAKLDLPVEFELALKSELSFFELLSRARALMTTSIAEGFGLAFLEPWLAGRPVCGRDLPEITDDFRSDGIELPFLYQRLEVPVEWIGRGRLLDHAAAGQEKNLAAYGRKPGPDCLARLEAAWVEDDRVDFGRLSEELQQQVIRRLVADPGQAGCLIPNRLPELKTCDGPLPGNRAVLEEKYSLRGYGRRLADVYRSLLASSVSPLDALDGERLLDHFLAPERLTLLRVD